VKRNSLRKDKTPANRRNLPEGLNSRKTHAMEMLMQISVTCPGAMNLTSLMKRMEKNLTAPGIIKTQSTIIKESGLSKRTESCVEHTQIQQYNGSATISILLVCQVVLPSSHYEK
jgi:hypothetical protein